MKDYFEKTSEESLLYYIHLKEKEDGLVHIDDIVGEYDAVNMDTFWIVCLIQERAAGIYKKMNVKENFDDFVWRLKGEVFEMRTSEIFR